MNWIIENKEWLFSGVGLTIISFIVGFFIKKKNSELKTHQQVIKSGSDSTNIQGGRDVHVTLGEKNDQ
ncbi:hypothetical protein [Niallia circulans]|uniref:hypothetical protein n=1 Tax=Niallia circulans TaxID=1397 RepID=UPI001F41EE91|nr:hypothetical protein [Niallia circulans]MCF2649679.1 hypothetical protein [Niallia circulans]